MILMINATRIYRGFDSMEFNAICAKLKENGFKEETNENGTTVYRLPLREEYRCYSELYPYYDNGFVMEGKLYYDNPSYEGIYAISEALVEHGFAPLKDTDVFEGWQAVDYAAEVFPGFFSHFMGLMGLMGLMSLMGPMGLIGLMGLMGFWVRSL